jgi:hypothetical protein
MLDKFLEIYEKIFISIFETAIIIYNQTNDKQNFTIRMPLIGVGAFLNAYKGDKLNLQTQIIDKLIKVRNKYKLNNNIILDVCIIDSELKKYYDSELKKYYDSKSCDNLFNLIENSNLKHTMIVNAWDNKSFIGNGLRRDGSIDGWLVGGWGPNENLLNSSYLHNAFFSNNILESKNWYIIEKNNDNTITTQYNNKKTEKVNLKNNSITNAVTPETSKSNNCSIS